MKEIYGIQGGEGSFNHLALQHYLETLREAGINAMVTIKYLYTTANVLSALAAEEIDYGLFASENNIGGEVEETKQAMAEFEFDQNFSVEEEIKMEIEHYLMMRADTSLDEIEIIMSHPQVIKQCQQNLTHLFPDLALKSGNGDEIDTALVAQKLAHGELPSNVAVLGPKGLADLYPQLQLAEINGHQHGLQDKTSTTTFLLVKNN